MLSLSVAQYVDILMLSETKLYSTFPLAQFLIKGSPVSHRLDRNSKDDGFLLHVRIKSLFYHCRDTLFHRILRFYFLN